MIKANFVYLCPGVENEIREISDEEAKYDYLIDDQGLDGKTLWVKDKKASFLLHEIWFRECDFITVDFSDLEADLKEVSEDETV